MNAPARMPRPRRQRCEYERPEIEITTDEGRVNDAAIAALAMSPNVFVRGTSLVEVIESAAAGSVLARDDGASIIRAIPKSVLRDRLARIAKYRKLQTVGKTEKTVDAHPPAWNVEAVHSMGAYPGIKPLVGVVEGPVLRPDCTVLTEPGYDERSGLYVASSLAVAVGDAPSHAECLEACALIADVFVDFPFAENESRSTAIAAVLTPFARHAIQGPTPLTHVDANTRGSGKSLMADVVSVIATGRKIARTTYATNEEEMAKRITAIALEGTGLVLLDNVASGTTLGSAPLDLVLTSCTINERVLGESRNTGPIPMRAVWFSTGNNILLAADTARRTLRIRLESPNENPEDREGFKHGNLIEYVQRARPLLAAAALTVLRGYHVAGRPNPPSAYGSFEEWSSLVRGAVMWCGHADPKLTQQVLRAEADTEASALRALIGAVSALEADAVTARDIIDQAGTNAELRDALEAFAPARTPNALPSPKTLSRVLQKFRDRIVDGRALRHAGKNRADVQLWRVSVATVES